MRHIDKIIPRRCLLPLLLLVAVNMLAYYGGMALSGVFPVHNWALPIDDWFPIRPIWAVIYVSSFVLWVVNYILISRDSSPMVYRLAAADITGKCIGFLFFLFLPTTIQQPSLAEFGWEAFLLRIVYFFDEPTNLFPSLHCFMSWMAFRPMLNCKHFHRSYKIIVFVWCLLIFVSTLYTKQHVFLDVLGGWLLAELCYDTAPYLPLMHLLRRANRKLDPEYALSSL